MLVVTLMKQFNFIKQMRQCNEVRTGGAGTSRAEREMSPSGARAAGASWHQPASDWPVPPFSPNDSGMPVFCRVAAVQGHQGAFDGRQQQQPQQQPAAAAAAAELGGSHLVRTHHREGRLRKKAVQAGYARRQHRQAETAGSPPGRR